MTQSQPTSTSHPLLPAVAASARILMGLLFVVAGAAKSLEPVVFYWEAISYLELVDVSREAWPRIGRITLVLAPLEVFLGVALLIGWRPRFCLPAATGLMLLFLAITGLAWYRQADIDCGCFGTLAKRTPGEAFVEDAVMLGLLLTAWRWGTARWVATRWKGASSLVFGAGTVTAAVLVVGFAPQSDRVASSDLKPGVRLTGIELTGADGIELSEGRYLVELFSPRCGRCKSTVPKLNHWAGTPGVPRIVALNEYPPDDESLKDFVRQTGPRYEIASISSSDWMRLTWRHGWPRLAYVEDGVIQRVWEYDQMPSVSQLVRLSGD